MKPKWTKQDTIRQGKRPHTKAGQGNLEGGNESQEQEKESEMHLFPLLGLPQKHQDNSHNLHARTCCRLLRHHVFCCYFLWAHSAHANGDMISKVLFFHLWCYIHWSLTAKAEQELKAVSRGSSRVETMEDCCLLDCARAHYNYCSYWLAQSWYHSDWPLLQQLAIKKKYAPTEMPTGYLMQLILHLSFPLPKCIKLRAEISPPKYESNNSSAIGKYARM